MLRLAILLIITLAISCKSKKEETPQEDNWILANRKVSTDKLNAFGFPDTTYTKMYTYQNYNVKDSSEMFAVSKYDDERRLISKSFFLVGKDGSPFLKSQSRYTYSGKNLAAAIDEANGVLTKHEKYSYDTSGKLLKSTIIRMKNFDKIFAIDEDEILQKEKLVNQAYDTLNITYRYDAGNKNIGGDMVDNRGNLIRRDVNIYSGNSPISTYNFGPGGDTLQRIVYVQQGDKITSQSENDNFIIATAMNSGFVTGKLTLDKKKNEKLRQEWTYANGRLAEEKVYINEQKNSKQ
ncbi:MAG: hypothetical protein JWR72_3760 [Flavisolibacter sp.]|jgi:hypothetical protein|nr:hypothetical protein [Flavisolibacter sp.]